MENKILLNSKIDKKSSNKNNIINVELGSKQKLLPNSHMVTKVNLLDQYNEERRSCDTVRLTCVINPICSNVLFNNMSEIVKDEGSPDVISLNYTPKSNISGVVCKGGLTWSDYEAVRDTQLSNDECGYTYHCGLNIFNNHLLRSKAFKTVCKLNSPNNTFNTIEDYMRTADGDSIGGYIDTYQADASPKLKLHLYLHDEVMTYKEAVKSKLIEENGWFGFINNGKLLTYLDESKNVTLNINKPINNKKVCDFIDMYPERDLYSFNPKYNHFRNRLEKNWNYCLTYPSSSTTKGMSFIDSDTNALKTIYFDENVRDYNGLESIVMYSISKHGLKVGDYVNIYRDKEIIIYNAKVTSVTDDYIFSFFKNSITISKSWIEIDNDKNQYSVDSRHFTCNTNKTALYEDDTNNIFYIVNNRVNIDINSINIGYKKVVSGIENEYYVRIFSRLPNWRFSKVKPNEKNVNKKDSTLLEECRKLENDFQNSLTKMAYSKNIYSDDISQIVFTDDINISFLKDNLGRPLSEIFITFIKNNRGYKEWYGKEGKAINIKSDKVEYSHCFGKVNCAFKLSDESLVNDNRYPNATSINNVDNKMGIILDGIIRNDVVDIDEDEIDYYSDINYYGDLCTYNSIECLEQSIQYVHHRFNTAMRELNSRDKSNDKFNEMKLDAEVLFDDYDEKGFTIKKENIMDAHRRKEGYCYIPHYNIPLKSFGIDLQTQYPKFFTLAGFKQVENGYEIYTLENNYIEFSDKFMIYDKIKNIYYTCIAKEILNYKKLVCKITDENGDSVSLSVSDFNNYKVFKPDVTIPSYAKIADDGTCRYYWRELIQNGYDNNSDNETYPFTNNALYINKMVDMYVRRQDPSNALKEYSINGSSMRSNVYPYDADANQIFVDNQDNFYNEINITC